MDRVDPWKPYKSIDFSDESIVRYSVDTRDFHCAPNDDPDATLKKIPAALDNHPDRFYHTAEEIVQVLDRLYNESGGEGDWRCLWFKENSTIPRKVSYNWNLKYLRIYRLPKGLVIANNNEYILRKEFLQGELDQELLNFIKK